MGRPSRGTGEPSPFPPHGVEAGETASPECTAETARPARTSTRLRAQYLKPAALPFAYDKRCGMMPSPQHLFASGFGRHNCLDRSGPRR